MKRFRFRFLRFGRKRRNVHVRGSSVLFKRFSSFEGLELRTLLTGSSLVSDSALVGTGLVDDPHVSPIEQLSLVSMLSSTLGGQSNDDAPVAAPLAAGEAETSDPNAPPTADPLVEGQTIRVDVFLEDLNGNPITNVDVGADFNVKVFVTDIRTNPSFPGVAGAFVNLSFDPSLISLINPNSLIIDPKFELLLPGLKDTSTPGQIIAGGNYLELNPANLPDPGEPQLLFTVTLRATGSGSVIFNTSYDDFNGDGVWANVGSDDVLNADNVVFNTASLTVDSQPALSIGNVTQLEGDTDSEFVFTVTLSAPSSQQVTVAYNTVAGTATSGVDFLPTSGTLVFEPGATTKLITVTVIGDTESEPDETFSVVLTNPTNATLDVATGIGTILDDDAPLLVIQDVSQPEGDDVNFMVFTVTLTKASNSTVTVEYATIDGTALAGSDYLATSGTLTFAAGSSDPQFITVTILGDTIEEDNETFRVVLSNPSGAEFQGSGEAVGTILNDDGPVLSLGPSEVTVVEGDSGESFVVFTVTLNQANDQAVTVVYNTVDGTATAGSDYVATSGTLTFAPGSTEPQFITVAVLGDTVDEADETFSLVLSSPTNATIATSTAVVTIQDDDGPTITMQGPSSVNEDAGNYVITVVLSAASPQTVTVAWATADGTATAGSDYVANSGTLTFAPGQTTALITVALIADDVVEPNETFFINLSGAQNADIGQAQFVATIANDDEVPVVNVVAPPPQNEGNAGTTPFVFTVSLSATSTETITVEYATASLIAQAGSDFIATSGTLTFAPGETTKTVTVLVIGDTIFEDANETFRLDISNPTGATLGTSSATAVIVDDDPLPVITIQDVTGPEGDTGTTDFVFTVSLTNASVNPVTVQYTTQDGTATAGSDYIATSGTLTFAPGELTKLITVQVIGDLIAEGNETFVVALSGASGGTIGDAAAIGTILDEATDNIQIQPSSISGKVFIDSDGNGMQNGTEKSLAGITVTLTGPTNAVTTTNMDGSYAFGNLNPGTYTVRFFLPTQYKDGTAILGSEGGALVDDGFTFTIGGNGGIEAANYHFATGGLLSQFISKRLLTSSYLSSSNQGIGQVAVSIGSVTNPINASNVTNTTISGTGTIGATISVIATDGTNSTAPQTTTVGANGTWSISGINVVTLADGTITYNVTASGNGTSDVDSITTVKDTVAPSVAITSVTNPINNSNVTDTSISGTGTAGATISVVATDGTNSTTTHTATVNASGQWSIGGINVSALANGTITYNVTATDGAGNTATTSITSTKDTDAPALVVTSVTDPIGPNNQQNVSISGTGTAGDTITVNITDSAGGSVGPLSTTVDTNGNWSFDEIDLTNLASGTITFTVVATDAAGNTTQVVETATKVTSTSVAISNVTDPINAANADDVSINGTGAAGATISVVVSDGTNSTEAYTTTVDSEGNWSISGIDVTDLNDGTLTFTVTATDTVGNTAEDETEAFKDTIAPELEIDEVTDPINLSNYTNTTISGTGEAGATISVVVSDGTNSTEAHTTTVDSEGNWSISGINVGELNDGTLTYTVTASDAAGNQTVATITAEKTTVAIVDVPDPITQANQDEVTVSGTGQVGATVVVVATDGVDSVQSIEVTIDENGNWSVTLDVSSLADGTITFVATATEGDDSAQTSRTALKDTVAEGEILEVTDPVNAANADNVFLTGLAELGATVSVVVTDGVTSTEAVNAPSEAGVWAISGIDVSGLADGTITYVVTITDELGNVTVYTTEALKDTIAPDLAIDEVTDPIGIASAHDVSINGASEPGATISVVVTDGSQTTEAYTTTVDGEGNWSISGINVSALADGTLTFIVTATDAAGNDTIEQITAEKTTVAVSEVTDPVTQSNLTEIVVSGTGQVGATVSVVATDGVNNVTADDVVIDAEGNWSVTFDLSSLSDGTITFNVTATDGEFTVETSATATKDTVAEGEILSVTDPVNAANAANASLSGTAEDGATVSIVVTDGVESTMAVEAIVEDGTWSITGIDVSGLADGTITYQVTITDALGNVTIYTMTADKDTVAPELEIDSVTNPISISSSASVSISGTGEPGATISVVVSDGVNSTAAVTTTVDGEGNWSLDGIDVSSLADGTLTFTVTASDAAGNETVDTITAEKTTLGIASVTDPITQSNENEVTISGTGEAGATIDVLASDGTNVVVADSIDIDEFGNWSITLDVSSLADGTITFEVIATLGENTVQRSTTAEKDTVAEGEILAVTDPINAENVSDVSISGTAEVGATVAVSITDGVTTIDPTAPEVGVDGSWSLSGLDLAALLDGTITFTVTVTDAHGNVTIYTETASKDTVPPEVEIAGIDPEVINAEAATAVAISGTGEAGSSVFVTASRGENTVTSETVTVDENGEWSLIMDVSSLADGEIVFTATATDAAGNSSTDSSTANKDTITNVVVNVGTGKVSAANVSSVVLFGSREIGAEVVVTISDGVTTLEQTSTTGTGMAWSILGWDLSELADGTLTIIATATDLAGNTATHQIQVTKDTVALLTIDSVTDPIDAENHTDTTISGTGEAGASISVVASDGVNSTIAFAIEVDSEGNWSISGIDVSMLNDGTITYTVTATDTFGNVTVDSITAAKDTEAEPLVLLAEGDQQGDSDDLFGEDEDWLAMD